MRKLLSYLVLTIVVVLFFFSSEEHGIPLFDWIQDPRGSYARNEILVAEERALAEGLLPEPPEPEPDLSGLPGISGAPGSELDALLDSARTGVRGLVRNLDGVRLVGVVVTLESSSSPSRSVATDEHGAFLLEVAEFEGRLRVDPLFWVLLGGDTQVTATGSHRHDLVVAARLDVSGRVVDGDGRPIAGAEVYGYAPLSAAAAPQLEVPLPARFEQRVTTGSSGEFSLLGLPELPYCRLEAFQTGYKRLRRDAPQATVEDLVLILQKDPRASQASQGETPEPNQGAGGEPEPAGGDPKPADPSGGKSGGGGGTYEASDGLERPSDG